MGIENQYLGNPNLKKAFVSQEFTKENILEFQKCMNDPQYFIEKYIKIVSLVHNIYKIGERLNSLHTTFIEHVKHTCHSAV